MSHKRNLKFSSDFRIDRNLSENQYGFIVYRTDGKSMPKGWITSFNAHCNLGEENYEENAWIEYGIQSPTGDSSDHCHFTVPCWNFKQAKEIVNYWHTGSVEMIEDYEEQQRMDQLMDLSS